MARRTLLRAGRDMAPFSYPLEGGAAVRRMAREDGSFADLAEEIARDRGIAEALRRRAARVLGSRATSDRIECCVQTAWMRALQTARRRGDTMSRGMPAVEALLGYLARSVDFVGRELWDPTRDPDRERRPTAGDLDEEGAPVIGVLAGPCGGEDPVDQAIRSERRCRLIDALGSLSPDARRVVVLRYIVGLSGAEVGVLEKQSPEAVRARLYRAMSELRAKAPERLREGTLRRAA